MLETKYDEIFEFWIPGVCLSGKLVSKTKISWQAMLSGEKWCMYNVSIAGVSYWYYSQWTIIHRTILHTFYNNLLLFRHLTSGLYRKYFIGRHSFEVRSNFLEAISRAFEMTAGRPCRVLWTLCCWDWPCTTPCWSSPRCWWWACQAFILITLFLLTQPTGQH